LHIIKIFWEEVGNLKVAAGNLWLRSRAIRNPVKPLTKANNIVALVFAGMRKNVTQYKKY